MTDISMPLSMLTAYSRPDNEADGYVGYYYDGVRSKRHDLRVYITPLDLVLQTTDGVRRLRAADVQPIDAHTHGVLFLHLRDGGSCELSASEALLNQLRMIGVAVKPDAAMTRALHTDRRIAALALVFLVAVVAAFYIWLLPSATATAVTLIPNAYQQRWGTSIMEQLDRNGFLQPSQLPQAQQGAIGERFSTMLDALDANTAQSFRLYIRHADIGPNAFALPGNAIVLTDELVVLLDDDLDALDGVLAHEIGHAQHQHGLRNFIQSTALTLLGSALIGDYSSALATAPAALASMRYSRAFETEADVFAHGVLCNRGLDPARTAVFFDRMLAKKDHVGNVLPEYLMTHPSTARRAAYFRTSCQSSQ